MRDKLATIIFTCLVLKLSLVQGKDSKDSSEDDATNSSKRILFGQLANPADFPYLVRLRIKNDLLCGGSIINNGWVMSAAHCLYDAACQVRIMPAVWGGERGIEPIECYVHPQYRPNYYEYDISLMRIPENSLQDGPQPICLPPPGTHFQAGTPATITGWGQTEETIFPDGLLRAETMIEDWDTCNKEWQEIDPKCAVDRTCQDLPNGVLCTKSAGDVPSGTCFGDSGGPVIVDGCVVGINSFVELRNGVCKVGAPSMHTNVVDYLPWINSLLSGMRTRRMDVRPKN